MKTVNFMKVGISTAFTVTKNGQKVHLLLSKPGLQSNYFDVVDKTLCGIQTKMAYYPIERQSKTPNFCQTCDNRWKALVNSTDVNNE